jgi:hypothetical protein
MRYPGGLSSTSFLRNPQYHSPGDTAETLDDERMAGAVDGVCNAVLEIAGAAKRRVP